MRRSMGRLCWLMALGFSAFAACAPSPRSGPPARPTIVAVGSASAEPEPAAPEPELSTGHGELDPSFGEQGKWIHRGRPGENRVSALALGPDGSIFGVGHMPFPEQHDIAVLKLRANGSLDPSFGDHGIARVGNRHGFGTAVAVQSDRKVLVAGYIYPGQGRLEDVLLARLDADGKLDRSFGTDGIMLQDFGKSDDRPHAVYALPGGAVLITGIHSRNADEYDVYAARYDKSGAPDLGFGNQGLALFNAAPGREFATRSVLLPDGSIVLGGYVVRPHAGFVARFTRNGSPDTGFGSGGSTVVGDADVGSAWALGADREGRVLLGARSDKGPAVVLRFTRDGILDRTWGEGGVAHGDPAGEDQLYGFAVERSGAVVGAGFRGLAEEAVIQVTRWTPKGALDPSFGHGGVVTTKLDKLDFAFCAVGDGKGGLFVGGSSNDSFLVLKYRI